MSPRFVIFLDIDGVLNNETWFQAERPDGRFGLDPDNVDALSEIVRRTGARIVLSSSQRRLKGVEERLRRAGVAPIFGKTPHRPELGRGAEIALWLKANEHFDGYVILDDDVDDLAEHSEHIVHTSPETGLTPELAEEAIRLLESQAEIVEWVCVQPRD